MPAPLHLPPGSVRAIVTLALVLAVIAIAVIGRQVPESLSTLAVMATAYYFKARGDEPQKGAPDAAQ